MIRSLAILVAIFAAGVACADERVTIPLSSVWATEMPGSRPLADPRNNNPRDVEAREAQLTREILTALGQEQPEGKLAGPGFAVEGVGIDALQQAHDILVDKRKPSSLRTGSDLSLVFFTHASSNHVHLDGVSRHGRRIEVKYRFAVNVRQYHRARIALIPLGALPKGVYRVDITRLQTKYAETTPKISAALNNVARLVVCKSFEFAVNDSPAK